MSLPLIFTISRICFLVKLGHFGLVGLFGAGSQTSSLLQQDRRRRRLGDEREALVFENRDDDREDITGLLLVWLR